MPGRFSPRFGHSRPLSVATGTTGSPSARYSPAKPDLSGGVSPGGTRVPSGKMNTDRPSAFAAAPAFIMLLSAAADASRSTGIAP